MTQKPQHPPIKQVPIPKPPVDAGYVPPAPPPQPVNDKRGYVPPIPPRPKEK